ncbi:MAG: CARDB domain-containing protein [Candidatus Bathyarchaeia archaeon]
MKVEIYNITGLFGLEIQLSWNASLLNYTSHIVKIPVETYPDGVLHNPSFQVVNEVNITGGTYLAVFASLGGSTPSFNGTGLVFEMNFTVLDYGTCPLQIKHSALSTRKGQPISHTVEHGLFSNLLYDVAVIDVVPSQYTAFIGDVLNITVTVVNNGTSRPEFFNVTVYYDSVSIETQEMVGLAPSGEETMIFSWNTSDVPPGSYLLSANASIVPEETSTENNGYEDGEVTLTVEPIHDIAVLALAPLKTVAFKGFCFHINVTLKNEGTFFETFNLTLRANTIVINETQVNLFQDEETTVTFTWELEDATEYDPYILNVTANPVSGENDTLDNTLEYSGLKVVHPSDFDADMDVDIFDIVLITYVYGSQKGDGRYENNFDVNCDGEINIFDIVIMVPYYGYEAP